MFVSKVTSYWKVYSWIIKFHIIISEYFCVHQHHVFLFFCVCVCMSFCAEIMCVRWQEDRITVHQRLRMNSNRSQRYTNICIWSLYSRGRVTRSTSITVYCYCLWRNTVWNYLHAWPLPHLYIHSVWHTSIYHCQKDSEMSLWSANDQSNVYTDSMGSRYSVWFRVLQHVC